MRLSATTIVWLVSNTGSSALGVSGNWPSSPACKRASTGCGSRDSSSYRCTIAHASAHVVWSGTVGPLAITSSGLPITSLNASVISVAGATARASCPPFTALMCLRRQFTSLMVAPLASSASVIPWMSSSVSPAAGSDQQCRTAAGQQRNHQIVFPRRFGELQNAVARLHARLIGARMVRLFDRYDLRGTGMARLHHHEAVRNSLAQRFFHGARHRRAGLARADHEDAPVLAQIIDAAGNLQPVALARKEPSRRRERIHSSQRLLQDRQYLPAACWIWFENRWVKHHRWAASIIYVVAALLLRRHTEPIARPVHLVDAVVEQCAHRSVLSTPFRRVRRLASTQRPDSASVV